MEIGIHYKLYQQVGQQKAYLRMTPTTLYFTHTLRMEPKWTNASSFEQLIISGGYEVGLTLLSHISSVEGGPQLILNLRKTRIAFKEWIDNIPSCKTDNVYSKICASITISRKSLHQFEKCKPPPFVFGLKLNNFDYFKQPGLQREKLRFLKQFINYWEPRIRKLEITDLSAFLVEQVHQKFTKLEEITLNHNCLLEYSSLASKLLKFKCLRKISLPLTWEASLLNEVTNLIVFKSCYPNFELLLNFKRGCSDWFVSDSRNSEYFQKFVLAVNESSSSIKLLKFGIGFITKLMSKCDAAEYTKFMRKIIWIHLDSRAISRLNCISNRNMLSNCNWVCYKQISKDSQEVDKMCRLDIQPLEIGINNETILTSLPGSLTFIHLQINDFGPRRLHDLLVLVSKQCPSLNTLSLAMKYRRPVLSHSVSWSKPKFPNLKYVSIRIMYGFYDSATSTKAILFDTMRIHEMPLLTLKLSGSWVGNNNFMIFNTQCINLIMSGTLSQTLIQFGLFSFAVVEETKQLLESLKQRVQENREILVKRNGLQLKPDFSCDHCVFQSCIINAAYFG